MAWVEPAWVAHWLKRWRWRRKQRKKAWSHSDSLSVPSPLASTPGRGRPCQRGCIKAPALAFTLRSWRPPGAAVPPAGPGKLVPGGVRTRRLRAVLGLQTTSAATRVPSASTGHFHKQPIWGAQGEGDRTPLVPTVPVLPAGPQGNASTQLETPGSKGKGGPDGCACPTRASLAPRAAAPPRAALGPTPRTEEAAWAAMALTFLLVLLTLATLCTRLHRNFRRGESIYWGPTMDSQDTVAAVLKRRLLIPPRRIKRSRGRLLPPTLDSGPEGDSSD